MRVSSTSKFTNGAMAYRHLSESSQGSDLNFDIDIQEEMYTHSARRTPAFTRVMTLLLTSFLLLQSFLIIRLYNMRSTCTKESRSPESITTETRWHGEPVYMSLNNAYDYLWNETESSGLILSSEGLIDNHEEVGSITM